MKLKSKKDEIAPWNTFEQKIQASYLPHPVLKNQHSDQQIKQQRYLKTEKTQPQRYLSIDSLLRQKVQSSNIKRQQCIPSLRRIQGKKVREIITLNKNLIDMLNNVYQNKKIQTQSNLKQRENSKKKKASKDFTNDLKRQRNFAFLDQKFSQQRRKQQIEDLRRSLIYKLNPSLDVLIKAKERLSLINNIGSERILKSYSVRNLQWHQIEPKYDDDIVEISKQMSNKKKLTFSYTGSNFRIKDNPKNQNKKKSMLKYTSEHIIDRLYDRF